MLGKWLTGGNREKSRRTKVVGRLLGRRRGLTLEPLESRRLLVHGIDDHIHPFLEIFVNGQEVPIPANIGLSATAEFSPHTHDATGKLHIGEGLPAGIDQTHRYVTLDDFFDVWRTTNVGDATRNNPNAFFSSTQLLNNVADATHSVFMTVNGVASTEFESYIPEDGDRIVLSYASTDGTPSLAPISNVTLLGGAPLFVPLDGLDPNGQAITYTVTANSNSSLVSTSVPTGNPFVQMQVDGFGSMIFELFQDKAPRPANRMVTLANQHFYDGLTFHRVINNFVIQGGDPTGTGGGGSTLGNFDDQFHVDLQHTRTGLLSYAKSSDDTNDSQFFVTEGPARHLDFNHSIFGLLVDGESVRDAISNVPVDGSSKPTTAVTIESVRVINDVQDGVLLLKAAEGATGTATLTVTATDSAGHSTQRTFVVTVTPDTANGGPFLNDIPAQRTTVNTAKTINLSSQDVEGNAVTYTAVKGDALASTVTVNATTGVITATPPTGFVGTMLVRATVAAAAGQPNDTQDKSDIQTFAVAVAPLAPTGLDLPAASDTGFSSTDKITKLATPSITVNGVTSGATVKLFEGTTLLGQAVASGTSATITTSSLVSGTHVLTATQTVSSIESTASSSLTIKVDTVAPDFTTTAPTSAKVGTVLTYDAGTNEEGAIGLGYTLASAPTGVTIDAASGIVSWTPTAAQLGAQSFQIIATDAAGNSTTQNVPLTVAELDLVQFRILITDTNGTTLTSLQPNQSFQIRVATKDLRATPSGVFAAYLDVLYGATLASVDGAIIYGSQFPNVKSGITTTAGLIDEAGAVAGFTAGDGTELLVLTIPMKALAAGTLNVTGDPSDIAPSHSVLLFSRNDPVPNNQIKFVNATATIGSSITARNDTFNVNEDSVQTTLSVLTNDSLAAGASGTLTVSSVGSTNHGGTVSVAPGETGVRYQPAANFFGDETFTYVVTAGIETATATVTVQVHPVNDPPTGNPDSLQVPKNSSNNILDVLVNDSFAPDATETLRVTAVSNVIGGAATIGPNGAFISFTPAAGFTGNATLNYTLADPSNATATTSATISVSGTNSNPTAVNDTATVAEDSTNNTVNVLANDTSTPDVGETLTVTAVGTPTQGGTVTIGAGGANVRYSPAANFFGTDSFTYTISDGNGGSSTATAAITVTNVNDNPTAVNDSTAVAENSASSVVNVLANDSIAPDTGETLTVTAVTQGVRGGLVAIGAGGANVTYRPAAGFVGTDTFTYTNSDGHGGTATATVTATVSNSNDNPTATADTATVNEDTSANAINVLANDSFAPDTGETLTVTAVGVPDQGGQVTVGAGGANVLYTPKANFAGTEKFTYTIGDGNGGAATATVTVAVTNLNDPPTAVNDTFTISRNSTNQSLAVLANDSSAPDTGEILRVTAAGTTSNGGTVTIGDGSAVIYTPAANFLGTDTFTYTVSDGNQGSSTATANVNVAQFVPSSLAGIVFLDLNHDGLRQANESPIAGVTITLTGPTGGANTPQTKETDAQGRYQFTNLAPGSYTISESQPEFLGDGQETAGSQGGTVQNNTIVVNLAENTNGTNNNFAELRPASQIRFRDFLARTPRDYAMAALDTAGAALWTSGWFDLHLTNVSSPSAANLKLDSVNDAAANFTTQLPKTASTIETLQTTTTGKVLRFNGGSSTYNFQAAAGAGAGEGEGGPSFDAPTTPPKSLPALPPGAAPASRSATHAAATDAALAQIAEPTSNRSALSRFGARRASTSSYSAAVDQVLRNL